MKKNTIKNSIQTLKPLNLPGRKDLEIHSNNRLLDKFMSKKIIKNITSPSSKILDRRKFNTVKKKNNLTKISPLIIMMKRSHNKIISNQKINNSETKKGNLSNKMWKDNSINKILPSLQSSQKSKTLEIKTLKVSLRSELNLLRRQKMTNRIIYTTYTINKKEIYWKMTSMSTPQHKVIPLKDQLPMIKTLKNMLMTMKWSLWHK